MGDYLEHAGQNIDLEPEWLTPEHDEIGRQQFACENCGHRIVRVQGVWGHPDNGYSSWCDNPDNHKAKPPSWVK